jgi:hypothetical protein
VVQEARTRSTFERRGEKGGVAGKRRTSMGQEMTERWFHCTGGGWNYQNWVGKFTKPGVRKCWQISHLRRDRVKEQDGTRNGKETNQDGERHGVGIPGEGLPNLRPRVPQAAPATRGPTEGQRTLAAPASPRARWWPERGGAAHSRSLGPPARPGWDPWILGDAEVKASGEAGGEGGKDSGVRGDRHRPHSPGWWPETRHRRGFSDARMRAGAGLPTRSGPGCGTRPRSPQGWPPAAASVDPPWLLRRPLSSSDSRHHRRSRRRRRFRPRALRPAPSKRRPEGETNEWTSTTPKTLDLSLRRLSPGVTNEVKRQIKLISLSHVLVHEKKKLWSTVNSPHTWTLPSPERAPEFYACATGPRARRQPHLLAMPTRSSRGRVMDSYSVRVGPVC